MKDAALVRRCKSFRYLRTDPTDLRKRWSTAGEARSEALPIHVLHDNIRLTALFHNLMDGTDERMVQSGRGAGLTIETFARSLVADESQGTGFHSNDSVQLLVSGSENLPHAASTNQLENAVMPHAVRNHATESSCRPFSRQLAIGKPAIVAADPFDARRTLDKGARLASSAYIKKS